MDDAVKALVKKLDSFDRAVRIDALRRLAVISPAGKPAEPSVVNLHCHTFFSYNAYGFSPAHIVWFAGREGWETVGTVDFDTMAAVEETLLAGEIAGVRSVSGLETRVFVREYGNRVINSPGEPGVYYLMGTGFYRQPSAGSPADVCLQRMADLARQRNLKMVRRLNLFLKDISLDYEEDVLPLTPSGNATERHLVFALSRKARERFAGDENGLAGFWGEKLGLPEAQIAEELSRPVRFEESIRSRLMKQGGPGYLPPEQGMFPTLPEVIAMTRECDALPTATWLDGTSEGEKDPEALLSFLLEKGVAAVNIIPDRNWNISDPKEKEVKVERLAEVVRTARDLHLPLVAGTEMNKPGQKMIDDFAAPELAPYREYFREGALFVYGHTVMGRFFKKGCQGAWARKHLPGRVDRNRFYLAAGRAWNPAETNPQKAPLQKLAREEITPQEILDVLQ